MDVDHVQLTDGVVGFNCVLPDFLLDLSISERGLLKSSIKIVDSSVSLAILSVLSVF